MNCSVIFDINNINLITTNLQSCREVNEVLMLLPQGFDVLTLINLHGHCGLIANLRPGPGFYHSIQMQEGINSCQSML